MQIAKRLFYICSMKKICFILLSFVLLFACKPNNKAQDDLSMQNYYSVYKSDSLLVDIVSYIDKLPENTKAENRFDPANRNYYIEGFKTRFQFVNYFISKDSTHYFAAFAKTASLYNKKRLVSGKFKIQNSLITDFEEVLITKKLTEQKLNVIKDSIFSQIIQNKPINHPEIEWPNSTIIYSKAFHKWVSK